MSLFAALLTIVLLLLNSHQQLAIPLFSHDFNAWLLPAIAPIKGLGMPYRDYWAIEPPALLLSTALWGSVSQSLAWFHLLYTLLQIGIVWLYWRILSRVFPRRTSLTLYVVGLWIYFSPAVQSMFFPSEINGLFFSLLGLNILLGPAKPVRQAFFASLAFGLAGQMKEVFAFSLLALVPLILQSGLVNWRQLLKTVAASAAGLTVVATITIAYLTGTDSLNAYREVMVNKATTFQITNFRFLLGHSYRALQFPIDRFLQVDYSLPLLILIIMVLGLIARSQTDGRYLRIKLPVRLYTVSVVLSFWLGSWLGYLAQNRYGDKYDIAILFPIILLLGFIASAFANMLPIIRAGNKDIFFALILLVLLAPNRSFLAAPLNQERSFRVREYLQRWRNLENPSLLTLSATIKAGTDREDCIQGVYGWGISNLYLYSDRKPCTRFYLPNIVTPDQIAEYRSALIENPPAALYYSTYGADLNTADFESNVFDYGRVIARCYRPDGAIENLYWSKENEHLPSCLRKVLVGVVESASTRTVKESR